MSKVKMYFKGTSGIDKPVDFHGNEINVGDKLTFDYLDPFFADRGIDTTKYEGEPCFVVEEHKSGKGLCGKGIDSRLYLHDFRFKFCEIVKDLTH